MLGIYWCCQVEERLVDLWRRVQGGREGRKGGGGGGRAIGCLGCLGLKG